jgi:hypothetical protein
MGSLRLKAIRRKDTANLLPNKVMVNLPNIAINNHHTDNHPHNHTLPKDNMARHLHKHHMALHRLKAILRKDTAVLLLQSADMAPLLPSNIHLPNSNTHNLPLPH